MCTNLFWFRFQSHYIFFLFDFSITLFDYLLRCMWNWLQFIFVNLFLFRLCFTYWYFLVFDLFFYSFLSIFFNLFILLFDFARLVDLNNNFLRIWCSHELFNCLLFKRRFRIILMSINFYLIFLLVTNLFAENV